MPPAVDTKLWGNGQLADKSAIEILTKKFYQGITRITNSISYAI